LGVNSEISWTDATWNPIRGCSMAKGSETGGCLNCYAARMASRNLPELKSPTTGKSFARILQSGPRWTGDVELIESALSLPLKWRAPKRIFVNSMSDLFHEALTDEQIDRVFAVMALCPQHVFQVLTKRPERMLAYMTGPTAFTQWPPQNVWLGTSVEDQATADARIPLLLQTAATVRFVSYEPALGPVDFRRWLNDLRIPSCMSGDGPYQGPNRIDWIIVGGESGPGSRPFDLRWARQTVEQCKEAGVACFVKQFGAWILGDHAGFTVNRWLLPDGSVFTPPIIGPRAGERPCKANGYLVDAIGFSLFDRKGGDMAEWPEDLRVREFPAASR
jgi:protein gp37